GGRLAFPDRRIGVKSSRDSGYSGFWRTQGLDQNAAESAESAESKSTWWDCWQVAEEEKTATTTAVDSTHGYFLRADSSMSQAASGKSTKSLNSPAPRSHKPPSITTHSPLIYSERSLSKNAARLASSSWRPKRFIG